VSDASGEFGVSEDAERLHGLRPPLSAILAAATALRAHVEMTEDERDKFLNVIIRSAERLAGMLGDDDEPD